MPKPSFRIVLVTNVLLAGLVSESSASQRVVDALMDRQAIPLISPPVVAEYRTTLLFPAVIARFPMLTPQRVAMALHRLRYVAEEYTNVRIRFEFERDPDDAKFIELAIVGRATHIVTLDRDLLSLSGGRSDASKRLRQRAAGVEILLPGPFLAQLGHM